MGKADKLIDLKIPMNLWLVFYILPSKYDYKYKLAQEVLSMIKQKKALSLSYFKSPCKQKKNR